MTGENNLNGMVIQITVTCVASGVYYALIQLEGKEYGKKLVLLK